MKLGWLSDIHLNFMEQARLRDFLDDFASHEVDGWLVSGDIEEADSVAALLRQFEAAVRRKTFFVLGNHDFYGGSFSSVRADILALVEESEHLI